jgi:hypothetical protein
LLEAEGGCQEGLALLKNTAKRREAVREALLAQGEALDIWALAWAWGVTERTIQRDLQTIRQEPGDALDDSPKRAANFFAHLRDWAMREARDLESGLTASERVAWARLALDAERSRTETFDRTAPPPPPDEEDSPQEVVVRVEPPPGFPDVRPPVPAKHRAK